jgi:glucose-1-phosphate cytidylyltransferase
MKYYAHYGHREFILCLGYGADPIMRYFLEYDERRMNDFVYTEGGRSIELYNTDIQDWTITFVDTGLASNVGERLRRVQKFLGDDEEFLVNYADGLSDLDLDAYVDAFRQSGKIARFLTGPAPLTFHNVRTDDDGRVVEIENISQTNLRVNAGFFAFRRDIFDYMRQDEELVVEPFARLIEAGELIAEPYDGYWQPMDTFKDKNLLDEVVAAGVAPWQVWLRDDAGVDRVRGGA